MDKSKKQRGRSIFNLFDIIVILIAVALAALLFFMRQEQQNESSTAGTVRYTLELTGMLNGSADLIEPGDQLVDKVKKYDIGKVVSVQVDTTVQRAYDLENGGIVETPMAGQQTATIVVEAECTETSSQIIVDGGYIVAAGMEASLRGPGYWGSGYIMSVDRGDRQ